MTLFISVSRQLITRLLLTSGNTYRICLRRPKLNSIYAKASRVPRVIGCTSCTFRVHASFNADHIPSFDSLWVSCLHPQFGAKLYCCTPAFGPFAFSHQMQLARESRVVSICLMSSRMVNHKRSFVVAAIRLHAERSRFCGYLCAINSLILSCALLLSICALLAIFPTFRSVPTTRARFCAKDPWLR